MTLKEQIIQELVTKNILDCETLKRGDFWSKLKKQEKSEVNNAIFENAEQQTELRKLLAPTIAELLDSQFAEPIKPPRYFSFPPLYPALGILALLGALIIAINFFGKRNKKNSHGWQKREEIIPTKRL